MADKTDVMTEILDALAQVTARIWLSCGRESNFSFFYTQLGTQLQVPEPAPPVDRQNVAMNWELLLLVAMEWS